MLSSKTIVKAGGRIVIPATMRKYLNLEVGEGVLLKAEAGGIHITTLKKNIEVAQALIRKYNSRKVSLSKVLLAERRDKKMNNL